MGWYREWKPYVPVAARKAKAEKFATQLAKKEGRPLAPVKIDGRKMATTFWGNAWCENLERYSDFANRLPRGRTYARNGSVIDLQISRGQVHAIVGGSEVYQITIKIKTLPDAAWKQIKKDCSRSFGSLIDLLQGRFDKGVMERLTQERGGLFPEPKEISMRCSCPDYAGLCKHVAATMYGVGARLDTQPELLFALRDVDHLELIEQAVAGDNLNKSLQAETDSALAGSDLGELFGIELESGVKSAAISQKSQRAARTSQRKPDRAKKAKGKAESKTAKPSQKQSIADSLPAPTAEIQDQPTIKTSARRKSSAARTAVSQPATRVRVRVRKKPAAAAAG